MKLYYKKNKYIRVDRLLLLITLVLMISALLHKHTIIKQEPIVIVVKEVAKTSLPTKKEPFKTDYRMTYYFTNDNTNSTDITASGLKTSQFKVNNKGWYTYKGKLVVATANKRLLSWDKYKNSTQTFYNLYDELKLEIQGQVYEAVVLDVCGACMLSPKIDLFVKDRASGLDTQIKVIK